MSKETHQQFWLDRWQSNDTPWHQTEIESFLVEHIQLKKAARVLVPLCGQSLDMIWLQNQGYKVVGVELSEKAIRDFFYLHQTNFEIEETSSFKIFRSKNIEIIKGDFFDLKSEILGPIDAIYDRAAMIAISPNLREEYLLKCKELAGGSFLREDFEWLLITRESSNQEHQGPPFNLSFEDLKNLCSKWVILKCLKTRDRPSRSESPEIVKESLYRLQAKN